MRKLKIRETFLGIAAIATLTVAASAAPIVTTTTTKQPNATPVAGITDVSSTDLLTGLSPTSDSVLGSGLGSELTSTSLLLLTDGNFGAFSATDAGNADAVALTSGIGGSTASVLYYDLDLGASPTGYSITEINTYTGRGAGGGRTQNGYTISYATVDDPTTFTVLTSILTPWANDYVVKVSHEITDLDGVAALKFDFTSGIVNNWAAYREIDVIGAPVPEPAGLSLLALGALGLLTRRRKMN